MVGSGTATYWDSLAECGNQVKAYAPRRVTRLLWIWAWFACSFCVQFVKRTTTRRAPRLFDLLANLVPPLAANQAVEMLRGIGR